MLTLTRAAYVTSHVATSAFVPPGNGKVTILHAATADLDLGLTSAARDRPWETCDAIGGALGELDDLAHVVVLSLLMNILATGLMRNCSGVPWDEVVDIDDAPHDRSSGVRLGGILRALDARRSGMLIIHVRRSMPMWL